jgi:hypothetical protein
VKGAVLIEALGPMSKPVEGTPQRLREAFRQRSSFGELRYHDQGYTAPSEDRSLLLTGFRFPDDVVLDDGRSMQ